MPGIFHRPEAARWQLTAVGASCSALWLTPVRLQPLAAGTPAPADADGVLLRVGPQHGWALLLPEGSPVRHNGLPVAAGLRMLEHRDALARSAPVFFTTEEQAHVRAHAGAAVACPRCRKDVHPGDAAVRCPSCGVVHHESAERSCWTYAAACALCKQPTALDAGLQWTPQAL